MRQKNSYAVIIFSTKLSVNLSQISLPEGKWDFFFVCEPKACSFRASTTNGNLKQNAQAQTAVGMQTVSVL